MLFSNFDFSSNKINENQEKLDHIVESMGHYYKVCLYKIWYNFVLKFTYGAHCGCDVIIQYCF